MFEIALIDGIGAFAFLLAFYYAHFSYRQSRATAEFWLIYSTAMILGFFWACTVVLEWTGFVPAIMDDFQQPLLAATAITLAVMARLSYDGLIKPKE